MEMTLAPAVSIVVPVYKTEKYLRNCVESVLAQSSEDFELILVDDGSPDKSGEICDELAKKDLRIRVFHQQNGGVTSARRLGVEQARGEWINFVDSDDLLPKDALKILIDEASDDTDWVQGWKVDFNDSETPKEKMRTGTIKSFDLVGLVENMLMHHAPLWGKIVRKKLFSPHVFDIPCDIKRGEDTLMNLRLIANRPRKAKEIDKVVYLYRQQEASVCSTYLRTEGYNLRYFKFLFTETREISTPGTEERLSRVLSQCMFRYVAGVVRNELPVKFPHRLAILICRGVRPRPRNGFFIYLCLRFNCLGVYRFVAKILRFLHGRKLDVEGKTLLE